MKLLGPGMSGGPRPNKICGICFTRRHTLEVPRFVLNGVSTKVPVSFQRRNFSEEDSSSGIARDRFRDGRRGDEARDRDRDREREREREGGGEKPMERQFGQSRRLLAK